MRLHEINAYINNGGKFFIKEDNKVKEVRFANITMAPRYSCSICTWWIVFNYRVAGENGIRTLGRWEHKKVIFYTDIKSCASDSKNDQLEVTKCDGSLVDDYVALKILKDHGVEIAQGYGSKWPIGYVWENCRVKQVHPKVEVELLSQEMYLDDDYYLTEEECRMENSIDVVMFAE